MKLIYLITLGLPMAIGHQFVLPNAMNNTHRICSTGFKISSQGMTGYRCVGNRTPLHLSCLSGYDAGRLRKLPKKANYKFGAYPKTPPNLKL